MQLVRRRGWQLDTTCPTSAMAPEESKGLLYSQSPFWERGGKKSLCCQASAGPVPRRATARPSGIPNSSHSHLLTAPTVHISTYLPSSSLAYLFHTER